MWEAVIITPAEHRKCFTPKENTGVGTIPSFRTLHPPEVRPAITACSSISEEVRLSLPTATSPWFPRWVARARPSL
ncbi:MAG: hypothetical protein QXM46_03390 [Candidatus Hadarchaeales archaeon]